ncbi:MAG TPA: acyl-CoA thioesterase [Actinomycetota bacterium]|nr:acyl-CoA thioesterase [Actinomycetota bacterium]
MYEHQERIRWRDVDSYGHVNNAVYLNYLEECRDRWITQVLGDRFGFVIVRVAIDYRRELSLEDESVTVTCRGTGYGTSSIRTAEQVLMRDGTVAAEAASVVVKHDDRARAAVALTEAERALLDAAIADGG